MAIILKQIYKGARPVTDKNSLSLIGSLIQSQVIGGYGKNFNTVDFSSPDGEMLQRLVRDVWNFSAAKNYHTLRDLTLALVDENGKTRTFEQFEEAAKKISATYNVTWLRTEYNMAVGSATMAARWTDFTKTAEIMPYLQYQTVGDDRVRNEHALLNGVIRKISDEFWSTHYPPNGWGCRCDVIQLATGTASETEKIPNVPISPMFKTNLANSGLIFPPGHPYYNGVAPEVLKQALCYLPDDVVYNEVYKSDSGARVLLHILHGIDETARNITTAKFLADQGYTVKLLPVLGESDDKIRELIYRTKSFKPGKNPDALINNRVAELKQAISSKSGIHNAIRRGGKQSEFLIIHLQEAIDSNDLDRYVRGKMNQSKAAKEVWVINSNGIAKYNQP